MSIEDTPYRNSGETYGEYIKRLEDIIYNWHDTHTTMLFKLKQFISMLKEEADTTDKARKEEHRGEWCYSEHDRIRMKSDVDMLKRVSTELEEIIVGTKLSQTSKEVRTP